MKPIIKWAGGKRWLVESEQLELPDFEGRYFEPFLGGGAIFFHLTPRRAILSDANHRLIDTYTAIKNDWQSVFNELKTLQAKHSKEFYYQERNRIRKMPHTKAAQFLYLNRTCWNGLYRENLNGKFNVPKGTNYDPDITSFGNSNLQGVEVSAAPNPRRYSFDVKFTF